MTKREKYTRRLIIQWNKHKIKTDLGKQTIPIFELIHVLSCVITDFADRGYKQEEEFKLNKHRRLKK